jgi:hypothetical protein
MALDLRISLLLLNILFFKHMYVLSMDIVSSVQLADNPFVDCFVCNLCQQYSLYFTQMLATKFSVPSLFNKQK